MGLVIRSSINYSILYYAGVILGYINTVLLFPNILNADEFGLTRLLLSVALIFAQIAQFGTPNMIMRYFTKIGNQIFTIGLTVSSVGILVLLILYVLFKNPIQLAYEEHSNLFNDYYYWVIPFAFSIVYFNVGDACLRSLYKNSFATLMVHVVLRLYWMLIIVLLYYGVFIFPDFIALYTLGYVIILFMTWGYLLRVKPINTSILVFDKIRKPFKEVFSYSAFLSLSGLSSFLLSKVDILMVAAYLGLVEAGIYAIGVYIASVVRVPASSIGRTAQVLVSEAFQKNDLSQIQSLYTKSALNQLIVSFGIFGLIFLNYSNILVFMPEAYANSFSVFIVIGITFLLDAAMGINGYITINSKYYKYDSLFSILLVLSAVGFNAALIPVFGLEGAAFATLISLVAYNLGRYLFIYSKFRLQPHSTATLFVLLIAAVSLIIVYLIPFLVNIWIDGLTRSILFVVLFFGPIFILKISKDLNSSIHSIFNAIFK